MTEVTEDNDDALAPSASELTVVEVPVVVLRGAEWFGEIETREGADE